MDIARIFLSSAERAPWGWGLFVLAIGYLSKTWPIINAQLIAVKDRIADRKATRENNALKEKHDDLLDCKTRLDAMDLRLTASEERAHNFELQLIGTLTAYRILDTEVETERPNSVGLKQARRVLNDVFKVSGTVPTDMTARVARAK